MNVTPLLLVPLFTGPFGIFDLGSLLLIVVLLYVAVQVGKVAFKVGAALLIILLLLRIIGM